MTPEARLLRSYRVAFQRYTSKGEEAPLREAYEIGRAALGSGVSLLDLVQAHHQVFLETLRETPEPMIEALCVAASDFVLEALAAYDMAQRRLLQYQPD